MGRVIPLVLGFFILTVAVKGQGRSVPVDVDLPVVKRIVLKNGLRTYTIKEQMPVCNLIMRIGYGSLDETNDTAGLSRLLALTLSQGGSVSYPGGKLHDLLESVGGEFAVDSSYEGVYISISVLERHAELAFRVLGSVMKEPNFTDEIFEKARILALDGLRRRYDDPSALAIDQFKKELFNGRGYGAIPDEKCIKGFNLSHVKGKWTSHAGTLNCMLGIVTSMDRGKTEDFLKKYLSDLKPGEESAPGKGFATIDTENNPVYFIERDVPQSTIVTGCIAPSVDYKGIPELEIMNYILGGGSFNSRLIKEVRVKRGYAYAVQSVIRFRKSTGLFLAYALTANDNVPSVLDIMNREIQLCTDRSISSDELGWARDSIINSYIFRFNTPSMVLRDRMVREYYGLPEDYHSRFLERISTLTPDSVRHEAESLFDKGVFTLVLGPEKVLEELKKNREVKLVHSIVEK